MQNKASMQPPAGNCEFSFSKSRFDTSVFVISRKLTASIIMSTLSLLVLHRPCKQGGNMERNRFDKGDQVRIKGLQTRPTWNGMKAKIKYAFREDKWRWPIEIIEGPDLGKSALLKPENLKEIAVQINEEQMELTEQGVGRFALNLMAKMNRMDSEKCRWCSKRNGLRRCRRCYNETKDDRFIARYCSKSCQKKHWLKHKYFCGQMYPSE